MLPPPFYFYFAYLLLLALFYIQLLVFAVCRFWQARAVESFLRGATSYADQMFLLKRGLLEVNNPRTPGHPFFTSSVTFLKLVCLSPLSQHILFCIIDSGCTSRDVLQSYFDLLGELMKFNIDAFNRFNKYVNTEEKVCLRCSNRAPWARLWQADVT